MKIQTVNVVEMSEGKILGLTSYDDTPAGNEAANSHFREICQENTDMSHYEIDICITQGEAPMLKGTSWEAFLIHSN